MIRHAESIQAAGKSPARWWMRLRTMADRHELRDGDMNCTWWSPLARRQPHASRAAKLAARCRRCEVMND